MYEHVNNNVLVCQVSTDGEYNMSSSHDSGLQHCAMLRMMKIGVAIDIPSRLAKAVTIATRYSAVRRQNRIKKGLVEW